MAEETENNPKNIVTDGLNRGAEIAKEAVKEGVKDSTKAVVKTVAKEAPKEIAESVKTGAKVGKEVVEIFCIVFNCPLESIFKLEILYFNPRVFPIAEIGSTTEEYPNPEIAIAEVE